MRSLISPRMGMIIVALCSSPFNPCNADPTQFCSDPAVVKVFGDLTKGKSDFFTETGEPVISVVGEKPTQDDGTYKCFVSVTFKVIRAQPGGSYGPGEQTKDFIFKLEMLNGGRFYATNMTGTGW